MTVAAHAAPAPPVPTPQSERMLPPQEALHSGADGTVHIRVRGQDIAMPVVDQNGESYVNVSDTSLASLFSTLSLTYRWSDDRKTATLYAPDLYVRMTMDGTVANVNGRNQSVAAPPLVGLQGHGAVSVRALAQFFNFRLQADGEGIYTFIPVVERVESGADGIVLRASGPFDVLTSANGNKVRLTISGVRWGCDERQMEFGDVQVSSGGMGTADDPLVIDMEAPVYWRGEVSHLLQNQVVVRMVPAFTVTPQQQTLSHLVHFGGAGEHNVLMDASGIVQEYWRYNTQTHLLTVDIPQAQASEKSTAAINTVEMDKVDVSTITTPYFPLVRMQLQLKAGYGFEVKLIDDGTSQRVMVRVAPEAVLPIPTDSGPVYTLLPGEGRGCIVIDPGHGGSDPGAMNRSMGLSEKDVTLDICMRLADILEKKGWRVKLTRTEDRDVSWAHSPDDVELGMRANMARSFNADLFVSVHCNAARSAAHNGTTIHWFKSIDYPLARDMCGALCAEGFADHGPIWNRFYVLRHTDIPAVLIETAFITNPSDAQRLGDAAVRQKMAEDIARALCLHMGRSAHDSAQQGQVPTGP